MADWTDEKKAKVIKMYMDAEPTPENSMELVKDIAEEIGETANGVRMILSKAEVYVKKEQKTTSKTTSEKATGKTKASKADVIAELNEAIEQAGKEVDAAITEKLTGKAAQYFKDIISSLLK